MNIKRVIDISIELNEKTLVWVDDAQPELKPVARQPNAPVNFTWLNFGAHAGTHIDAPFYLFSKLDTIDQVPLSSFMGMCQVLDLTSVETEIQIKDLISKQIKSSKILLKTKNSFDDQKVFHGNHITLAPDAAQFLVDKGVKLLGYDYQTFERGRSLDVHHVFLSKNIPLIDNLCLKDTEEKEYFLMCLPIKLTGIDAAPTRAVLIEE